MVEALGIIARAEDADEVKALDQDARGALRKHGIRFGQYTIFMQALLKPAPTRLRLVLWSLANGLDEFPEAPPPGLVTVPNIDEVPGQHYLLAGYRKAGQRAIRIDMLERLADMIRTEDSRGGFEAKPDMLSITGMTLEQFADLMQGLGYKAERAEREKVKPVVADAAGSTDTADQASAEAPAPVEAPAVAEDAAAPTEGEPAAEGPETEVFFTFTWGGNRGGQRGAREGGNRQGGKPRRDAGGPGGNRGDRPKGGKGKPKGKGGPKGDKGPKTFESRPPKKDKPIDPDNPFAVLAALKNKS
jgi:ATP-dependent RNA helicase SUPV3L1/SUV3